MKDRIKEEIKDAIVDFTYDHLKLKKIQKVSFKSNLSVPPPENATYQELQSYFRKGGILTTTYENTKDEYVKLIDTSSRNIDVILAHNLHQRKIYYKAINYSSIKIVIDELTASGYLVSNGHDHYSLKVTPKGDNHYEKGLSFRKDFQNQQIVRLSFRNSVISLVVAILSFAIVAANFLINLINGMNK